jgi:hypothetical protein
MEHQYTERRHAVKNEQRLIAVIALMFLFLAGGALSHSSVGLAAPVCSTCGKFITGTYWNVEGRELCDDCYQKSLMRCTGCGKKITGRYYKRSDGTFCEACYEKIAPRCLYCKKIPQGSYFTGGPGVICDECYKAHGPHCALCSKLLTGKYQEFTHSGKKICLDCMKRYPPCRTCAAPVGPHPVEVNRGFLLCPECARIAIMRNAQALPLLREARKTILAILAIEAFVPEKNLMLTDSETLRMENAKHVGYIPTKGVAGLHVYSMGISTIYVQKGLSPDFALEAIAHEYTHAWQCRNCPEDQDLTFREGFAEWVSYLVLLSKKDYATATLKLKETDPVYGEGLRKMILLEESLGRKAVIDYARHHNGFPANLRPPPPLHK